MSKKGAHSSGGGATRKKAKDQAMAAHLSPSPTTWNRRPEQWPYHSNKGTQHSRPGQRKEKP